MDELGIEHETYLNVPYELEAVHQGDLDEMLYPLATKKETDYVYDKPRKYSYVNDVSDDMDDWIETTQPEKSGTLLMYRDSFGESLLPFIADEVGRGYFSRLVPYNLTQIEQYHPNYVILEKVERNLPMFAIQTPVMEPMLTPNLFGPEAGTESTLEAEKSGSYLLLTGEIDEKYIKDKSEVFVSVRNEQTMEIKTYPAFYTITEDGKGNGYQIYLKGSSLQEGKLHISVLVQNSGENIIVTSKDVLWEEENDEKNNGLFIAYVLPDGSSCRLRKKRERNERKDRNDCKGKQERIPENWKRNGWGI